MKQGLVIGKFYPFHRGHQYLIDVARSKCDHLIVLVCAGAHQVIPAPLRAKWIQADNMGVDVRVIPDTLPDDDSAAWAAYTIELLGKAPDVVFTSEDYGPVYAKLMGSTHVMVDRARIHLPISGTRVRENPLVHWEYLAPSARGHHAKRIVVLGAESTGTTTLAKDLAKHYQTTWVPEYGREYSQRKMSQGNNEWVTDEFVHIAREQLRREDEAARSANRVLICDTDAFATLLWHERYMGTHAPQVEHIADERLHDLYILTGDEIPFVQDGYRDGEHIRHAMHARFEEELRRTARPFIVVRGSRVERLNTAISTIDQTLKLPRRLTIEQPILDPVVKFHKTKS